MSIGIMSIAFVPATKIGLLAPLIVLAGRLLQGFSAGMELGGVSVYLAEIATPGHKGFYVSWQSASQQAAVMLAALIGVVLTRRCPSRMAAWGWRVPFLVGCPIVPFLFNFRRSLEETDEFLARSTTQISEVFSLGRQRGHRGDRHALVDMTTVVFYMITAYTPTFGSPVLNFRTDSLIVTFCVASRTCSGCR